MANQMYGFSYGSSYGGGGAAANLSSLYTSRSVADSYLASSDSASLLGSSRYLSSSDPLFSSSASRLFTHSDSYSARIPGLDGSSPATTPRLTSQASSLWPGPPGVDVGALGSAAAADTLLPTLKRSSSEGN